MRSVARLAIVPPMDINTTCGSFELSLRSEIGRFGISGMTVGSFGVASTAGFRDACAAGFGGACAAAILAKANDEMMQVNFMYLTSSDR